jgi:hypothetical protein
LEPKSNSVKVKMAQQIINHSIFRPTLDGFEVELFLENTLPNIKPFAKMNIPGVHAKKVTNVTIEQTLNILDMDQFIAYNKLVTQSETYRVALRGKTRLHLGALPVVSVNYNKVLTMKGELSLATEWLSKLTNLSRPQQTCWIQGGKCQHQSYDVSGRQ